MFYVLVYMMNIFVFLCLMIIYFEQSIAKFDIKTRVVVYNLVKQLSLIIMVDLRY